MILRLRKHLRTVLVVIAVVVVLLLIGWFVYMRQGRWTWADWTGFGPYVDTEGNLQRGKTLWDWLELLIIPIVLVLGAFWLEKSERKNERMIANKRREDDKKLVKDQQGESALQAYFDRMTELLLDKDHPFSESKPETETWVIARARTMATFRVLDHERKGMLLKFLYEARLIGWTSKRIGDLGLPEDVLEPSVIALNGADLRGINLYAADLRGVNLSGANLSGADLSRADLYAANLTAANLGRTNLENTLLYRADLSRAILSRAHMSGANLSGAHLYTAILNEADLCESNLEDASLFKANLRGADLSGAYLRRADLSEADLNGVNFLGFILSPDYPSYVQFKLRGVDKRFSLPNEADLSEANLSGANLYWANVTNKQLREVKSLENTIMPDNKPFDPAVHSLDKDQLSS